MLSCLQSFHQFLRVSRKDDLLPGFMLCIPRWGRTQLLSHTKTRSAILLYAVSNESETRTRPILSAFWHPDALFCAGIAPQSIPASDPSHPQGAGPCGALQPCRWRRLCTVSSQKASHKGKNHASFLLPKLVKCYPQQFSSVGTKRTSQLLFHPMAVPERRSFLQTSSPQPPLAADACKTPTLQSNYLQLIYIRKTPERDFQKWVGLLTFGHKLQVFHPQVSRISLMMWDSKQWLGDGQGQSQVFAFWCNYDARKHHFQCLMIFGVTAFIPQSSNSSPASQQQ